MGLFPSKQPSNQPTDDSNETEADAPADHRYDGDGAGMMSRRAVEEIHGKDVHDENIRKAEEIRARRKD